MVENNLRVYELPWELQSKIIKHCDEKTIAKLCIAGKAFKEQIMLEIFHDKLLLSPFLSPESSLIRINDDRFKSYGVDTMENIKAKLKVIHDEYPLSRLLNFNIQEALLKRTKYRYSGFEGFLMLAGGLMSKIVDPFVTVSDIRDLDFDIDIFVVGRNWYVLHEIIRNLMTAMGFQEGDYFISKTFYGCYDVCCRGKRHRLQFIEGRYPTPFEVLAGFDLSICQFAYYNSAIYATHTAISSMKYRKMRTFKPCLYDDRLDKYAKRGFQLYNSQFYLLKRSEWTLESRRTAAKKMQDWLDGKVDDDFDEDEDRELLFPNYIACKPSVYYTEVEALHLSNCVRDGRAELALPNGLSFAMVSDVYKLSYCSNYNDHGLIESPLIEKILQNFSIRMRLKRRHVRVKHVLVEGKRYIKLAGRKYSRIHSKTGQTLSTKVDIHAGTKLRFTCTFNLMDEERDGYIQLQVHDIFLL